MLLCFKTKTAVQDLSTHTNVVTWKSPPLQAIPLVAASSLWNKKMLTTFLRDAPESWSCILKSMRLASILLPCFDQEWAAAATYDPSDPGADIVIPVPFQALPDVNMEVAGRPWW